MKVEKSSSSLGDTSKKRKGKHSFRIVRSTLDGRDGDGQLGEQNPDDGSPSHGHDQPLGESHEGHYGDLNADERALIFGNSDSASRDPASNDVHVTGGDRPPRNAIWAALVEPSLDGNSFAHLQDSTSFSVADDISPISAEDPLDDHGAALAAQVETHLQQKKLKKLEAYFNGSRSKVAVAILSYARAATMNSQLHVAHDDLDKVSSLIADQGRGTFYKTSA